MEYTDIRYSALLRVLILWVPEQHNWRTGWSPNELYEGEQSHALHNQAPNWNTIDFLWWNTLTSGTVTLLRVLILWVPELENWGTDGLQWLYEGEQSHAYIIKHPLKHNSLLVMNTLTSGTVTFTTCIDLWVPELETGGRMVSKWIVWGRAVSCYIIKHPIENNWLLVMEYTHIRYSDITTCIDSVSARVAQLRTDGLQMNCVRESSLMLT